MLRQLTLHLTCKQDFVFQSSLKLFRFTFDYGGKFLQAGVGLGVSILFPLCLNSCDSHVITICPPFFTVYWEAGAKVGWAGHEDGAETVWDSVKKKPLSEELEEVLCL